MDWTGSIWLTVQEADCPPSQMASYVHASSQDTIRSRSFTGKPCRMLRNEWTDAWAAEDTPDPLGMPLQNMVSMDAIVRTNRYASSPESQAVAFNPVGQVVGMIDGVQSVREVVTEIVEGYVDAVDRLNALQAD